MARVTNLVELLYLRLMERWEKTAPPDLHEGLLDGEPVRNSQMARLAYVLRKIAAGNENSVCRALAVHTRRQDGESYISQNSVWMKQPLPIATGWFLEGGMSLDQKKSLIRSLSRLKLSGAFVDAVANFVEGNSIQPFMPTKEDLPILQANMERAEREWTQNPLPPEMQALVNEGVQKLSATLPR
jgi:hypothetical protein